MGVDSIEVRGEGRGLWKEEGMEGVSRGLEDFYRGVVEHLRAYVPPAPKLSSQREETREPEPQLPESPAVTSTGEPRVGGSSGPEPVVGSTTAVQLYDGTT